MNITTLEKLFIHGLSDVYSAEKQITGALPQMARATTDEKLVAAFHQHLEKNQGQIERLDQVVESLEGLRINRVKCHALESLNEQAQEPIGSVEAGPVRYAGLIGAANITKLLLTARRVLWCPNGAIGMQ